MIILFELYNRLDLIEAWITSHQVSCSTITTRKISELFKPLTREEKDAAALKSTQCSVNEKENRISEKHKIVAEK